MVRDPIAIGIRKILKEKGLIQKVVAVKAGYSPQQLNDMLNNRKIIRAADIPPLAEALGVTVGDIYNAGRDMK